jgi:NAD(P)-dependent dehydrogenase (short-subunit alcohol dehydrogenase family)
MHRQYSIVHRETAEQEDIPVKFIRHLNISRAGPYSCITLKTFHIAALQPAPKHAYALWSSQCHLVYCRILERIDVQFWKALNITTYAQAPPLQNHDFTTPRQSKHHLRIDTSDRITSTKMSTPPRHVLITGGSRGIGLAIAKLFSQNSYRCTLISRSYTSLQSAVSQLHPCDPPHAYIAGDITSRDLSTGFWGAGPTNAFGTALPQPRATENATSKIDVLVNCAGVSQARLFTQTSAEDVHDTLTLNLEAMMLGTKYLMRKQYLRGKHKRYYGEQEEGPSAVVINVASLLGVSGGYGAVAYAASKAGVLGFTRALAAEYVSHGVRVNAIVPGYVATDMTADLNEEQLRQRIPLGRFGQPEEIAEAALFLAKNQYAHNCVLNLDGGLSAV